MMSVEIEKIKEKSLEKENELELKWMETTLNLQELLKEVTEELEKLKQNAATGTSSNSVPVVHIKVIGKLDPIISYILYKTFFS